MQIRTLREPQGAIWGIGALAHETDREAYQLPDADKERLEVNLSVGRERGFYTLQSQGDAAVTWLEQAASLWVEEVAP